MAKDNRRVAGGIIVLALAGIVLAVGLIAPASAHIGTVDHLWNVHLKPRVLLLVPLTRAQHDANPGTESTGSGIVTETAANTVTINAPTAGVLVAIGSIEIDNQNSGGPVSFASRGKVDGKKVDQATTYLNGDSSAGDVGGVAWTVTVRVKKGSHTVKQTVGPSSATTSFNYDYQNLTVTWYPSTRGSSTTS